MANTGTMSKSTHAANAARNGMESALLAAEGYTATEDILRAEWGYNDVYYNGEMDLDMVTWHFGEPYRMVSPGLIVKKSIPPSFLRTGVSMLRWSCDHVPGSQRRIYSA